MEGDLSTPGQQEKKKKEDTRGKAKEDTRTLDKSLPSLGLSFLIRQMRSWKISKIPHRVIFHGYKNKRFLQYLIITSDIHLVPPCFLF